MFIIPKEISSENKLWKSIYIKDFIAILGVLLFGWITSASIYKSFVFLYYVFLLSVTITLISKSSNNPNKRVWQSIYILFAKNNYTYHSLDHTLDFEVVEYDK